MQQIIHAGDVLLPIFYAISLGLYLSFFLVRSPSFGKAATRTLFISICLHLFVLIAKGIYYNLFPIDSLFASFSMLALTIAIIYYAIERLIREGRTGVFFLSIVFFLQLLSSMFITYSSTTNELLADPKFAVHTTFTLLGLSSLAISALYGLMYIMQAKQIKGHRFGPIYDGLPSLEILEKLGKSATGAGIILLGIGILLGHFWAYKVLGYFFKFDSKIIITDLAWFIYLGGWIATKRKNLYGLQMSMLSLWGFVIFFLSIIVVSIVGDTFHKFN